MQAALAAEHAAIHGYGVVGAHLSGRRRERARDAWNAHRAARDRLRSMLRQAGATPAPAAPDYALPHPVSGRESAVRLATRLEERVAAAYAELVAASQARRRRYAAKEIRDCALRAAHWRNSSTPFPGLPDGSATQ